MSGGFNALAQVMKVMQKLTQDEIRKRFETSKEFNEIFDAFQNALAQRMNDIELYRQLFWNHALTPAERCLFGEKLAKEFPDLAYDVFMWLANVFEVTNAMYDNYDLALEYYKKAADNKPWEHAPYTAAANCYEPDINIPSLSYLTEFLKRGTRTVREPQKIYERLAYFYDLSGNDEMSMFYRRKIDELRHPPQPPSPAP